MAKALHDTNKRSCLQDHMISRVRNGNRQFNRRNRAIFGAPRFGVLAGSSCEMPRRTLLRSTSIVEGTLLGLQMAWPATEMMKNRTFKSAQGGAWGRASQKWGCLGGAQESAHPPRFALGEGGRALSQNTLSSTFLTTLRSTFHSTHFRPALHQALPRALFGVLCGRPGQDWEV